MDMQPRHALLTVCALVALAALPHEAAAQLNECKLIDQAGLIDAPGSCIEKTLAEQVGIGQGDINTPGSSSYLIKRDPARAIRRGRQLFQRKFSSYEGLGPRVSLNSTGDIFETRRLGAGLSVAAPRATAGRAAAPASGATARRFPTAATRRTCSAWGSSRCSPTR
jgi:hypothetical protein